MWGGAAQSWPRFAVVDDLVPCTAKISRNGRVVIPDAFRRATRIVEQAITLGLELNKSSNLVEFRSVLSRNVDP